MVDIHVIQGGLGNQMFQYAHYLARKSMYPCAITLFDTHYCSGAHQGFELNRLFNLSCYHLSKKGLDIVFGIENAILCSKLRKHIWKRMFVYPEKNAWGYEEEAIAIKKSCVFEGYWQTDKYFKDIENVVRQEFGFNEKFVNHKSLQIAAEMHEKKGGYVSVHIRRGDYLQISNGAAVLPLSYYHNAIEIMNKKVTDPVFVFFSDDMKWVMENIHVTNAIYIDWNTGKDSWMDMYLMSKCNHNIIANSTFSWWGAWLNANPGKIVISPVWSGDIIPNDWIQI